ncbi:MAG: hypothetical protein J6X01_07080 [Bacteroidales bacterium]|nr:hypothetical protein [Bacteroidales bacterium]
MKKLPDTQKTLRIIFGVLAYLLLIPLVFIVFSYVPNAHWPYNLDRILLFLALVALITFLLRKQKIIVSVLWLLLLGFLAFGSLTNGYGFRLAYKDYKEMVYSIFTEPEPDSTPRDLRPFPHKTKYIQAVDYYNPEVRNYAVSLTADDSLKKYITEYHEYRRLIQCFAVFRDINRRWNYVNDPLGQEYLVKASENLGVFSGDCDDHSIMMAAAIMSIGGTMRLVHTTEHVYPEILIGDKDNLEDINYIIKQVMFKAESDGKRLHYHIDNQKQIWLNLDYTARYPGGEFMESEIISILNL